MAVDYRSRLVQFMNATLKDEENYHTWTYLEIRPMRVPSSWVPGQHVIGDCSKGVQYLCRWAGQDDPMGSFYGPYGNSSTLWLHNQHLDHPSELLVGDFVTFGFDGDEHATMVLEAGADPLLWSFGHQGAPNTYRLSGDGRPSQYLRNPLPVYVPTPQDRLRAMTGWFAWVAWRLGEGDWKPYGRTSATVRPNVPRVIPVSWWKRYAQFLLNRKKGNPPTTKEA
jgi:hypothetical protein